MNIVQVNDLERPYIENSTLYMPDDYQMAGDGATRWMIITEEPVVSILQIKWEHIAQTGWAAEWMFFMNGQEVKWDNVPDKIAVAREFRGDHWTPMPNDVIPWGDDIETLIALESS